MKIYNKCIKVFALATAALIFFVNPLVQAGNGTKTSSDSSAYSRYFATHPWLGLVLGQFTYGNITVWDVHLNEGTAVAIVKPGEMIHGKMSYSVDASNQGAFHRYHLVMGIAGIGPQDCGTHTWGLLSGAGKAKFTLKAPLEPGVYSVRFSYQEAATCEEARNVWNEPRGEPSEFATVAVIIVEP